MKKPSFGLGYLVLVSGLFALACGGGGAARHRAPGPALWIAPESARLAPADVQRLRAAGMEDFFVEVATLGAGGELRNMPEIVLPSTTPVTLVVRGELAKGFEATDSFCQTLGDAVRSLRQRTEERGLVPLGVHFDLAVGVAELEEYGRLMKTLRRARQGDLFLSAGIGRGLVTAEELTALTDQLDFVVAHLYGTPPGAPDDPAAWDTERLGRDLATLAEREVDTLLALATVGTGARVSRDGRVQETTAVRMKDFVRSPHLERAPEDLLAGSGRSLMRFRVTRGHRIGPLELSSGDMVRISRTAPGLIQRVLRNVDGKKGPRYVGELFVRLAGEQEGLALTVDNLVATLGNVPAAPALEPRVVVKSSRGDKVVLGVAIGNLNQESTDFATTGWNYLSLRVLGGHVLSVEPGEFQRYRLWLDGKEPRPGAGDWRRPDEVRLYTPMIEGGERVGGATVAFSVRSPQTALEIGGRFVLPEGRVMELDPWRGTFAELAGQ